MSSAPPIPNELAFFLRFFVEVGSLRDKAGRALHEVDFRDELSSSDERRCPYPGVRQGQRINQAALTGIVKDWASIKTLMRNLVTRTPALGELNGARVQAWARSLVPMFLPTYFAYASRTALDTTTSGLFKIMLDVPTTIDLMLAADCVAGRASSDTGDAALEIARFAEGTGILNNGEWACAGPEKLIVEMLDLLTVPPSRPRSDGALPPGLETDVDLETYFLYMIQQYAVSQAFQICTAYGMEIAFGAIRSDVPAESSPPPLKSAYATRRRLMLEFLVDEATTRRIVERFIDIAFQLGRLIATRATTASLDAMARAARATIATAAHGPVATVLDRHLALQGVLLEYVAEVRRLASSRWPALSAVCPIDASLFAGIDFPTRQLQSLIGGR